jgi:magnesium transporter
MYSVCRARGLWQECRAMQVAKLLGPAVQRLLSGSPEELAQALEELHTEDLAEILIELPDAQRVGLLEALEPAIAGEVLSRLPEELSAHMIEQLDVARAADLVSEMAADDRADLLQGLDALESPRSPG